MLAKIRFEADAQAEYEDALRYYADEADSLEAAHLFDTVVQVAVATICASPEVWRVAEQPDVRRYVRQRVPFILYYRYLPAENTVIVYAVMHGNREPGYWRGRLPF